MQAAWNYMMSWTVWYEIFWGNPVWTYAVAVLVFLLLLLGIYILRTYVIAFFHRISEKTKTEVDDVLVSMIESITPPFYIFISFFVATQSLVFHGSIRQFLYAVLLVWITIQTIVVLQHLVRFSVRRYVVKTNTHSSAASLIAGLIKISLWIIGLILVLSNLGVNVTSLVTGLGIGGIAVALAVQNILGDLFSYFTIHFDQPFKEGDFIEVGTMVGTIQKIGIKTTRIRSLRGEEVVIPNTQLTSASISNLRRLRERRIVFNFRVTYQTPTAVLREIPSMVKEIIDSVSNVRYERAHFFLYGPSSLDFEVVYFVEAPDYVVYMEANSEIMYQIKERFEERNIEFAYPTQTVFLEQGAKSTQ